MIGTETQDIATNVWTVVRRAERLNMMGFGVARRVRQFDRMTAKLAFVSVQELDAAGQFSIAGPVRNLVSASRNG
jgi:hypothetical protein